jgi:ArsR family transcriptional regulator, arsenate/arsenite/antimonite-responsive transcriptional repressor
MNNVKKYFVVFPLIVYLRYRINNKANSTAFFNDLIHRINTINIMAVHKKEEFGKKEQDLANFAKAIAHPARIAILKVLAQRDACICGEIVEVLPLAQSTVSQHLKALLEAGLIDGTVDGPRSCYCINWKVFSKFCDQFTNSFSKLIELRKGTYKGYLESSCKDPKNKCC